MNLGKENEMQEFKENLSQLDKGIKSLVAMLNRNGSGTVYFGVDDNGEVKGIEIGKKTLMTVRHRISELMEPKALCDIKELKDENGKSYISIFASGSDMPYSCDGRYYIRTVSADEHVGNELLRKMLASGDADLITQGTSEKQELTFSGMCAKLNKSGIHSSDTLEFRQNYGLYNDEGKFNKMAYILSDQNSLIIKTMRFAGFDKTVVEERASYQNQSLLSTVKQVLEYFELLNVSKKVSLESGTRKETSLFDYNSFREAWINACVHNNWNEMLPPSIYIYDDRIEVVSYGGLPYKLSKEGFFAGRSVPVNERLFRIFIACDFSEQSGHGIPEIVRNYGREAFCFDDGMLIVTLPFNYEPDIVAVRKEKEKKQERLRLTDNQYKVLDYLKNNRKAHLQEVADECNLSLGGVKKIVSKLQDADLLSRSGTKQNPEWIVY